MITTILKSQMAGFSLDEAITIFFGKSVEVEKVWNMHTCGTVEMNGSPFDWTMKTDSYTFVPAE